MAALVALLMKSRRTALDMAVYQRRISSVKRMFEPENSLMNFMLPFSLANLAQDRKTRSRDEKETRNGGRTAFKTGRSDCFRGHDYFTGRHLEIGIPGNLAKL